MVMMIIIEGRRETNLYDMVVLGELLGICITYNDVMKHELACSLNEKVE